MINIVPKSKSIQVKVVVLFMIIALFSVLSTAVTIINYERNNSESKEIHRLDSIAEILTPTLTAAVLFRDEVTTNELLLPLMSDPTIVDARVLHNDNELFVSFSSPYIDLDVQDTHYITVSKQLILDNIDYGKLVIRANDLSIREHINVYTSFIALIGIVTLSTSLLLAIIFSRYLVKPIFNLGQLANKVTKTGNYTLRAKKTTTDEIGTLTEYFNLMLENIEYRDNTLESEVKQRTGELEIANDKLKLQAYQDSLSGLPNRRYLNEKLQEIVTSYGLGIIEGFSILFLDLDGFKEVNDTMGHDHGDELLIEVANRLIGAVGESDLVARLGGDEFTILLSDVIDREPSGRVARSIHTALSEPFYINGEEVVVTVSIGIAIFPVNGTNVETILKCADLAMYEAKGEGRDCFRYFDSIMMHRLVEKREVVSDLKTALREEQFELYFQPIVDLETGDIEKVEALIRWNHPVKGMVFPNDFIPVAEEFGIINDIGEWVLKTATQHIPLLQSIFNKDVQISINVSPTQFKGDFKWLDTWLHESKLFKVDVSLISFEITEHLLMTSDQIVKNRLKQLKGLGVDIAIDDFGVGYSSLAYLQQINVDVLKIDRCFIQNLSGDSNSQALCKAMINMADELGIEVVAEGIEEQVHSELLASYGCRFGQGYYFSKPVPIDRLIDLSLQYQSA